MGTSAVLDGVTLLIFADHTTSALPKASRPLLRPHHPRSCPRNPVNSRRGRLLERQLEIPMSSMRRPAAVSSPRLRRRQERGDPDNPAPPTLPQYQKIPSCSIQGRPGRLSANNPGREMATPGLGAEPSARLLTMRVLMPGSPSPPPSGQPTSQYPGPRSLPIHPPGRPQRSLRRPLEPKSQCTLPRPSAFHPNPLIKLSHVWTDFWPKNRTSSLLTAWVSWKM